PAAHEYAQKHPGKFDKHLLELYDALNGPSGLRAMALNDKSLSPYYESAKAQFNEMALLLSGLNIRQVFLLKTLTAWDKLPPSIREARLLDFFKGKERDRDIAELGAMISCLQM